MGEDYIEDDPMKEGMSKEGDEKRGRCVRMSIERGGSRMKVEQKGGG
jgi:hypothetical protein